MANSSNSSNKTLTKILFSEIFRQNPVPLTQWQRIYEKTIEGYKKCSESSEKKQYESHVEDHQFWNTLHLLSSWNLINFGFDGSLIELTPLGHQIAGLMF